MTFDQPSWIAGYTYAWRLVFRGMTKEELIAYLKLSIEEEAPSAFGFELDNVRYEVQDLMWPIETDEGQCQYAKDRGWDGEGDYVDAFDFVLEQEMNKLEARKDEWIAEFIKERITELQEMTKEQIIEKEMKDIDQSAPGRYRLATNT